MAEPRKAFGGRFLRRKMVDSETLAAFIDEYGPWAGLFFDRMILNSDDDGRFLASPIVANARCFPHHHRPTPQIARFLEGMVQYEFIILYSGEMGSRYGAWRKWRKHQPMPRKDRYVPSELPAPPDGTTDVRTGRPSGTRSDIPSGRPEEEEEIEEETEEEGGPPKPGCPFCRKPTAGPLQHYHDAAKERLKRCLVIPPQKAGPAIARVEAQVGKERAHALFVAYLASEDQFVLKQGHSLLTFASESIQNGLAAAVDGGFTHGSRTRTPARQNPASRW